MNAFRTLSRKIERQRSRVDSSHAAAWYLQAARGVVEGSLAAHRLHGVRRMMSMRKALNRGHSMGESMEKKKDVQILKSLNSVFDEEEDESQHNIVEHSRPRVLHFEKWYEEFEQKNVSCTNLTQESMDACLDALKTKILSDHHGFISRLPSGDLTKVDKQNLKLELESRFIAQSIKVPKLKWKEGLDSTVFRNKLIPLFNGVDDSILEYYFHEFDSDSNGSISHEECQQLLHAILNNEKEVVKNIVLDHEGDMDKKFVKKLTDHLDELDWEEKVPEKIRCVWHFAKKEDSAGLSFQNFLDSQKQDFPSLHTLRQQYIHALFDERLGFYEAKAKKRKNQIIGVLFTLSVAIFDYVLAVI